MLENRVVHEIISKNMEPGGHKLRHNMVHTSSRLDRHGHMHARVHTHKYVIFIAFPRQQLYANAPQCYVTRTMSVLFKCIFYPFRSAWLWHLIISHGKTGLTDGPGKSLLIDTLKGLQTSGSSPHCNDGRICTWPAVATTHSLQTGNKDRESQLCLYCFTATCFGFCKNKSSCNVKNT